MKNHYIMGSVFNYHIRGKVHLFDQKRLKASSYFTSGSYEGVHCKNFCCDPIPEVWQDFECQNMDAVSDK